MVSCSEFDAKILLTIKSYQKYRREHLLSIIILEHNATLPMLNESLSLLKSSGLIKINDDNIALTDLGNKILLGANYLKSAKFYEKIIERLSSIDLLNDCETIVTKEEFDEIKKFVKFLNSSEKENSSIRYTIFMSIFYICAMFFVGAMIGFFVSGNLLGGLFLIPLALLLTGIFYIRFNSQASKNSDKEKDVAKFIIMPSIYSLIVNGVAFLFCFVATFVFDVRYVFGVIVLLFPLAIIYAYFSGYLKKKLKAGNYKTKYLATKLYSNEYYLGGINIFNGKHRVKQEGVSATLVNPVTKSALLDTNDVYSVVIRNRTIFYAVSKVGKSILLYFVRPEDIKIAKGFSLIDDVNKNALAEKSALKNCVQKEKEFIYSKDELIRAYTCKINDYFVVKCEVISFVMRLLDELENFTLTDEFILSTKTDFIWKEFDEVLFDDEKNNDEYLTAEIEVANYNGFLDNMFF